MGEPAKLEGRELAEVIARAKRTVEAIEHDEQNPVLELDAYARGTKLDQAICELGLFAIALVTVAGRYADLQRYIDEAKIAAGSERVAGEPLADFIRRVLTELADQLALNKALAMGEAS